MVCASAAEFDFYLAIERIPIGLAVTLEFIGPLLVLFWLKTFCRLFMGTLLQQQECLIARGQIME
jgi:threonine/homoserine efflux transporter RhtA